MRRFNTSLLLWSALALAIFAMASPAWTQSITGAIVGMVKDTDGGALPGATVTVTNVDTGLTRVVVTNNSGAYRVESLPVGRYDVQVQMDSFKTGVIESVTVNVASRVPAHFTLQLGALETELVVTADAPLIDTEVGSISGVVNEQEIRDLPLNGRDFLQLGLLQPGTTNSAPGAQVANAIAVNGQRFRSTNFLVDGIDNNAQGIGGATNATVPVDAVQEFRLIENNFPAEFGRNTGGILNVVTKSGGNDFHGSGFWFNRSDSTEARNFFNPEDPGERSRHQYGFTVGGPIKQDSTFFFVAFEATRDRSADVFTFSSPTQSLRDRAVGLAKDLVDEFPPTLPTSDFVDLDGDGVMDFGTASDENTSEFDRQNLLAKIDHNWNQGNDVITGRYLLDNAPLEDSFGALYYYGPPGFGIDNPFRAQSLSGQWTHVLGNSSVNEFRLGWTRNDNPFDRPNAVIPEIDLWDVQLSWGAAANLPQVFVEDTIQMYDSFAFNKGDHNFEAGGEMRYWKTDSVFNAFVDGNYGFDSSINFFEGGPADLLVLALNPVTGGPADMAREFTGAEWGFFFKDDWRVNDRLTLNLGVRYELFPVPSEKSDRIANGVDGDAVEFTDRVAGSAPCGLLPTGEVFCFGPGFDTSSLDPEGVALIQDGKVFEGDHNNWAPRFGLAYDLTGDGRTSIRLGAGVGYDRLFNNVFENVRFNPPFNAFQQFLGPAFGGDPIPLTIPASVPGDFSGGAASTRWMDPNLRTSYATNAFAGIQREVWKNTKVEVNYAGSFGRKLPRIEQLNRFSGDLLDGGTTRLTPNMSTANFRSNSVNSTYHSMQLQIQQRFYHGLSYQANYTFATLNDTNDSDVFGLNGDDIYSVTIENQSAERGTSNQQIVHRLVGNVSYELPWLKEAGGWKEAVLGGWQINSIFNIRSGFPFTVIDGSSFASGGDYNSDATRNDRPDLVGSGDPISGNPANGYLDPDDFASPCPDGDCTGGIYVGNTERNQFEAPGFWNFDFSFFKNFRIPMGQRDTTLQFRAEIFNLFNHPNFGLPVSQTQDPRFGKSTTASDARIFQFALKYIF